MPSDISRDDTPFSYLRLDSQPGPALPLSEADSSALIRGVLDAVFEPTELTTPSRRGGGAAWLPKVAAVLALALVGSAAEALYHVWHRRAQSIPAAVPPAPPRSALPVSIVPPAPPPPSEMAVPAPVPAPEALPAPRFVAPIDPLQHANQLRAEHRWRAAAAAYEHVIRSEPQDADAAAVAAGSLLLEHLNDPDGAIALFRRVLRGGDSGPLAPEALYGMAQVYQVRGDKVAEARTLSEFAHRYPDSVLATRVHERLRVLGQP